MLRMSWDVNDNLTSITKGNNSGVEYGYYNRGILLELLRNG